MRRGAIVSLVLALTSCGGSTKVVPAVVDPTAVVTTALADAVKLMRARRFDDAERRLARERRVAALDARELEKLDYYLATVMAYRGELSRAQQLVRAHTAAARGRGDTEAEAWMQSCSAWLRWAARDITGAVAENDRIAEIAGARMDSMDRHALLLSQHWDRAFFLIEQAANTDDDERAAAFARARQARDEYEALAREPDDHDEIRLLAAYFAWRSGDEAAARAALQGISPEQHDDARALYVLSVVLEGAGPTAAPSKARARLRSTVNLLAPLLERAAERRSSARGS